MEPRTIVEILYGSEVDRQEIEHLQYEALAASTTRPLASFEQACRHWNIDPAGLRVLIDEGTMCGRCYVPHCEKHVRVLGPMGYHWLSKEARDHAMEQEAEFNRRGWAGD